MTPPRKQRLAAVLFVLGGTAVTLALVLLALEENVNLFYEPAKVSERQAPHGVDIRAGGMVAAGSVVHDDTGLGVRFVLTDYQGHDFQVAFTGILPGMFREGQGILVDWPSWLRTAHSKRKRCSPSTTKTTCRRSCTTSPNAHPTQVDLAANQSQIRVASCGGFATLRCTTTELSSRCMRLKEIKLAGFKSFVIQPASCFPAIGTP